MRFRLGLIIGFGAGYYLGAMAGRERYEQMNRWLQKARQSDAFETATERARDVVDLGKEKAREITQDEGNGHAAGPSDVGSGPVREPFPRAGS